MADKLDKGSSVLCLQQLADEDNEESYQYARGAVTGIAPVRDKCTADLDPQYLDDLHRVWTGAIEECLPTNTVPELEVNDDLAGLSIFSEEALVDALRWRFMQDKTFTYCGRTLLSLNPLREIDAFNGRTLNSFIQGNEDPDMPHIFNMCLKARKMQCVTGRSAALVLGGESGAGKTEMARHIMRFFAPGPTEAQQKWSPQANADPQGKVLKSLTTILEAFGNAKTINNYNASRFGLLTQFSPSGTGLTAASCTQVLLDRSRLTSRDEPERNFHVFYQLLSGLSAREKEALELLNVDAYAYLKNGATTVPGVKDAEQFAKLLPALAEIGVKGPLRDDLFRILGGILACGNVTWTEENGEDGEMKGVLKQPRAMQLVAGRLGVAADRLGQVLARGGMISAQSQTDCLARTLYAEVFSWLVDAASQLLSAIPAGGSWMGILDLPGFEGLDTNSLEQLLFNHAEERLHQLFLERVVKAECVALTAEGVDLNDVTFQDNAVLIDLVDGTKTDPGIFTLLSEQCFSDDGTDDAFAIACSETLRDRYEPPSKRPLLTIAGGAAVRGFAIEHTWKPVGYSTAGFRERNSIELQEPLLQLLRESSSPLIRDLAAAMDDARAQRRGTLAERSCQGELRQILGVLGDEDVDLHFVKCLLPNRERKTIREKGCFNWQCVLSACRGHSVVDIVQLQRMPAPFTYRRSYSEFFVQFAALALGCWKLVRQDPKAAVEGILAKEANQFVTKKDVKVSNGFVMMTQDCLDRLDSQLDKVEKSITPVAELVQQAVKSNASGAQLAVSRERLAKLQACVRRRRVLKGELARRTLSRQFYGVVRLLQTAEVLKPRREAAITIEAHLRTALARQQYKEKRVEWRGLNLVSQVAGVWRCFVARRFVVDLRTSAGDMDIVSGIFEAAQLRLLYARARNEEATTKLQSLRRGVVGQRTVETIKKDREDYEIFQNAAETLLCRKKLVETETNQSIIALQSTRRGLVGRREATEKSESNQAEATVGIAFETLLARARFVRLRVEQATLVFQKDRRGMAAQRRVGDLKADRAASDVWMGVLSSLQNRTALVAVHTQKSVMNLQSLRRGKVARRQVEVMQTDVKAWAQTKGMMQTFLVRLEILERRTFLAAFMIQNNARAYLGRKKTNHMRFIRLQKSLSGAYHRSQATKLVMNLQAEAWLKMNCKRICSALEAVAWRRQHVQHLEHRSVITVQRVVRGMIDRKQVRHLRLIAAQRTLKRFWKSYEAKLEYCRCIRGRTSSALTSTLVSKMQTARVRAQFHAFKKHQKAVSHIQRVFRGHRSRRVFQQIYWQAKAKRAKRTLEGVIRKFHAIAFVYEEKEDQILDGMNTIYHCVLNTLKERVRFQDFSKNVFYSAAALQIQRVYRGWSTRRRPFIRLIKQAIDRVQLENKDRNLQRGHGAAALIQAIWRSWIARQVLLLPKVMHHLSVERNMIFDARSKDVSSLKSFRNAPAAERAYQLSNGAAMLANMSVNYYGDLTKRDFRNWPEAIEAMKNRGETIIDMGIGKQHAIASCQSGAVYTYYDPDSFGDKDAETLAEKLMLMPLNFREALRDPMPRITKIACGEGHTLLLSDEGLLFSWGNNNRGQCGVGKHLPEPVYLSATCLQKWALKPAIGIQPAEPERQQLPRIRAIACGPNHSGCIDAEGLLWFWGEHQGIGLFHLRPVRGSLGKGASGFLLFRMSQEVQKKREEHERLMRDDTQFPLNFNISQLSPAEQKAVIKQMANAPRPKAALRSPLKSRKPVVNYEAESQWTDDQSEVRSVQQEPDPMDTTKGIMMKSIGREEVGSLRQNLMSAQDVCAVKEVVGDVLAPTRCCNIVLACISESARLKAAGTPVLECWSGYEEYCAPVFPAPARGVQFNDVQIGAGMNCALSDKGYLYTWGIPEKGSLGRPAAVRQKPAGPERIPFFPQLAISLSQVAVGRDHVIALTTHGRVFTWGKVDACLGPSGFQRCTLEEPMYVEGLLRDLRVVRVAAGRLESVIATDEFDTVLGWEMLEMSAVGHRMLPVAFQYTFAGPRSGFNEARFDRLLMAQSEAVQLLFIAGATSSRPHLHGLEPYPEDVTKKLGHHFTRKNEAAKRRLDASARPQQTRKVRGVSATELFKWAARSSATRKPGITDPRLKRAAAAMVSPSFGSRKRDALDVDRDLSGFRRLALSRADSLVMGVDSDIYKDHEYDAFEALKDRHTGNGPLERISTGGIPLGSRDGMPPDGTRSDGGLRSDGFAGSARPSMSQLGSVSELESIR